MKARVFESSHDGIASNRGGESVRVCVDRKVHLLLASWWYDQTGDPKSASDTVYYGVEVPCDGSCLQREIELPVEAEALVQKFLISDGKDCDEYRRETPRYPAHA